MGLFDHFPYTNFHELNLDWILNALRELEHTINQFVAINALKYADPIQWNITSQYEKNTIVIDPLTGTAYISVQPVPSGVALTNTDYWTVVFDLGAFVVRAAKNFTNKWEDKTTLTATFPSNVNDWLIWGDVLYNVISPIVAGDQYVVGSNIVHFTAEDVTGHIQDLNTTDKSNLVAAINEILNHIGDLDDLNTIDKSNLVAATNEILNLIGNLIGDLNDLNTTNKSNLVAAINEVDNNVKLLDYYVTPEMFGAAGDGTTDDTLAVQAALRSGKDVVLKSNYKITSTVYADVNCNISCSGALITDGSFDAVTVGQITVYDQTGWFGNKTVELIILNDNPNWTALTTAIKLINLTHATLKLYVQNFNTGIEIIGNDFGCAWNSFDNFASYNCKYAVVFSEVGTGWTNQNTFIAGKISWYHTYAALHADSSDPCIGITVEGNENTFYNTSIDGQGTTQSDYDIYKGILCNGRWNHFDRIRLERVGSIDFNNDYNEILYPYWFANYTTINRAGDNSVAMVSYRDFEINANGTEGLKILNNSGRDLINCYNTGGTSSFKVENTGLIHALRGFFLNGARNYLGFTNTPDTIDTDIDDDSAYYVGNGAGVNPEISAILGVKQNSNSGEQYAFGYSGKVYQRNKSGGSWGSWERTALKDSELCKAMSKWGSSLQAKAHSSAASAILVVGGGTNADVYLLIDNNNKFKIVDNNTNITVTYTRDSNNNMNITTSVNSYLLLLYY